MDKLNIYLADGTYDGPIIMSSTASKILAVRVKKEDAAMYSNELDNPGIYLLLIGDDSVYVGQSGLDTIRSRVMNTHSGNIDSSWHTVLAFSHTDKNISSNELLFMENAMCEFIHNSVFHCATTTPAKAKCNQQYRLQHYHLNSVQIHACAQYVKDIQYYISCFVPSIFGSSTPAASEAAPTPSIETALFYYRNPKRNIDGKAEIGIHLGNTGKRKTTIKAGSHISAEVSNKFSQSESVKALREKLTVEGTIVNGTIMKDISFTSQSTAAQFLIGTSADGNTVWRTVDGNIPLKQLLE